MQQNTGANLLVHVLNNLIGIDMSWQFRSVG